MFKLKSQVDYGLILIENLKNSRGYLSIGKIVKKTNLPMRFLSQVANKLTKAKIIESKEGKNGGYRLRTKLSEVSLLQFFEALGQGIKLTKCVEGNKRCRFFSICQHREYLTQFLTPKLITLFKQIALSEVISFAQNKKNDVKA